MDAEERAGLSPGWDHCTGHGSAPRTTAPGRIHSTGHGLSTGQNHSTGHGLSTSPHHCRRCRTGLRPAAPRDTRAGHGPLGRWDGRSVGAAAPSPAPAELTARPAEDRTPEPGLNGAVWALGPARRAEAPGERSGELKDGARRPRARPAALPAPAPATAPRTPRRKCGPGRGGLTGASTNHRARPRPAVAKASNQLPRRSAGRRGEC